MGVLEDCLQREPWVQRVTAWMLACPYLACRLPRALMLSASTPSENNMAVYT
jgi:hypothetical protein